jgi:hypothetical protein
MLLPERGFMMRQSGLHVNGLEENAATRRRSRRYPCPRAPQRRAARIVRVVTAMPPKARAPQTQPRAASGGDHSQGDARPRRALCRARHGRCSSSSSALINGVTVGLLGTLPRPNSQPNFSTVPGQGTEGMSLSCPLRLLLPTCHSGDLPHGGYSILGASDPALLSRSLWCQMGHT